MQKATVNSLSDAVTGGMTHSSTEVRSKISKRYPSTLTKVMKRILPPLLIFILFISAWEGIVTLMDIKPYLLPKPSDIFIASRDNWSNLMVSVRTTAIEAIIGFTIAAVLGIVCAVLLSLSRWIERSVYPYAIILQTVPIVAIAPIIVIWFGAGLNAIVIITILMTFFPILTNTLIGLNSTDQNMKNLFYLYNATKLQTIWRLRLPAALPYIMAGLKISCSLAFIGAIVGEYIAGIGGGEGGLGYAITVAASRLRTPYLFACGLSSSILGISFYLIINALSNRLLKSWHESAMH